MKTVKIILRLPETEYADVLRIAEQRGVSFTEALRGVIATEKYLREVQSHGGKILTEDRGGSMQEVVFK